MLDPSMPRRPVYNAAPLPMTRGSIERILPLGVRVIDSLLTCGQGARFGIFAGAGVGKSTLLGMICRHSASEVLVVALIGERGREVPEFFSDILSPESRKRCVTIISTSDTNPVEKALAAETAMAVAEYFRDQGKKVLLMMDSLTRFVRAAREVAISTGEPVGRGGFPPSVFGRLARLVERAGPAPVGSITALFTVLIEGDDLRDPVADETISLVDGHLVLSRDIAASGRYPAIDVSRSISRVMQRICEPKQLEAAKRIRALIKKAEEMELLVQIGEYKPGADPEADEALKRKKAIETFLSQKVDEHAPIAKSITQLPLLLK